MKLRGQVATGADAARLVDTLDTLPRELLTTANPKTSKGACHGYRTAILHLAPAKVSGRNVCPHATPGCASACLNTSGHGGIGLDADGLNGVQAARIRRTRLFQRDRAGFMAQLVAELERHERVSLRDGLTPAARLNGLSDLPWERFPVVRGGETFPNIFAAFPGVRFYDYTKWPLRLRPLALDVENYSLTFSLAEDNDDKAADALARGVNVAAVFRGELPESYTLDGVRYPVVNGDETDLRFLDPSGVIVGLSAKGRAVNDTSGFVRQTVEA
jgi:hypothetical protein